MNNIDNIVIIEDIEDNRLIYSYWRFIDDLTHIYIVDIRFPILIFIFISIFISI